LNSTGVSLRLDGTINGNLYPSTASTFAVGTSTIPYLSGEITTLSGTTNVLRNGATNTTLLTTAASSAGVVMKLPPVIGTAGQFLTTDGVGNSSWTSTSGSGVSPSLVTSFSVSGSFTPTIGTKRIEVYVVGGGGAGGGASATNNSCGSGGGSGATAYGIYAITGITTSYVISIGAAGNTSSFSYSSVVLSAGPGGAGLTRGSNTPDTGDQYPVNANTTAANGTIPSTGAIFLGGYVIRGTLGGYGIMVAPDHGIAGYGGASYFGVGGIGGIANSNTTANGTAGTIGSGGGGGIQTTGGTATGGAGGIGVCYITEYF
jgi:hypothetical protein